MKYLIINADDFGYSKVFNTAILALIKDKMISSTTVMTNWITDDQAEQFRELTELRKSHNISVGLHLEFSEDESFEESINKQYQKFISVFDFEPSHVDIHKGMLFEGYKEAVIKFCTDKGFPVRNKHLGETDLVHTSQETISGTGKSFAELKATIESFQDGESYEILFHPGTYDPDSKSALNKEREEDVQNIRNINPLLAANDIKLISYFDLVKGI